MPWKALVVGLAIAALVAQLFLAQYQLVGASSSGSFGSAYMLDRLTGEVFYLVGPTRHKVVDRGPTP